MSQKGKKVPRDDKRRTAAGAFGKCRWAGKRDSEKCETTKRSNSNHQKIQTPFKKRKQEDDPYGRQAGRIT